MLSLLMQRAPRRAHSQTLTSTLLHLGAAGLFVLAIIDSSPLPTFSGTDIVTAILAASHRELWYEYAAAATAGSVVGAYLTFRIARKAGSAYLDKKFRKKKAAMFRKIFNRWASPVLFTSAAIPIPTPTSMFFAAAGASDFRRGRFLAIVTIARAIRFTTVALLAEHYGRHFTRVLRHPSQYWGWLVGFSLLIVILVVTGILLGRRLSAQYAD